MSENLKKNDQQEEIKYDELTNAPLTDHDYDGIKELDNDLPSWWRYLFYLSILFAIGYLMKYHVFKQGMLQQEEYLSEFPEYYENKEDTPEVKRVETVYEPLTSAEDIEAGNIIFKRNCAQCHEADGRGGDIGPNLTDEYWIHGGSYNDMIKTISDGVPAKGMQSWKVIIPKKQIEQVATHVWNLQGTNPPNPKSPQGEKYIRE